MKIDALFMEAERQIGIRQIDIDAPARGELQIEVKGCGVCAWDTYLFKGRDLKEPFPFGFGHEAVGYVAAVGENVQGFSVGDKVFCIESVPEMAQVINVPQERVGHLPDIAEAEFPYYILEPAACVISGMGCMTITPGANVAIIGCGYMGLLNVQAYRRSLIGRLTCFDIDPSKLALAQKFGADACYLSNTPEGMEAARAYAAAGGADIVVECSGSQPGLTLASDLVCTAGMISNFAWHRGERTVHTSSWHLRGIGILNTSDARDPYFPRNIERTARLVQQGVFDQHDLITHIMDYHRAQEMLTIAESKADGYIKGVITF
ncbi:MAG: zinc-binding dehydrogenase [Butyricicoccus sp.]